MFLIFSILPSLSLLFQNGISYRLAPVNATTPTVMRAPGDSTCSFALESAMDELAYELNIDPIELRLINYAEVDPRNGKPWSSKELKECYRQGAERFGWSQRIPHLTIFGAGFDALPVVDFAKELGWYVTAIDPLARLQTKERFNRCDRVVLSLRDKTKIELFDSPTAVVVMSHNYLYDLEFLQMLSLISIPYLGILEPKKRNNRLLQDLQIEGYIFQPEQELYSPVGLDIGADNPETIALSIIAEIQAVIQNRQGGFLKHRLLPIHSDFKVAISQ